MGVAFPYCAEPELEEIMNDPMVQKLMRIDGVADGNMAPLLKESMQRLHIEPKRESVA